MAQEVKEAAKKVEDYIISVPDFPKPGILFHDITGILNDADGLKLPRETVGVSYDLEYGSASIEVHKDAVRPGQKVVIIG